MSPRFPIPHRRAVPVALACAVTAFAAPVVVAPTPAAAAALKPGASGKAVKTLQRKLRIAADGEWGSATTRALKRFQRRNGLTATGKLDTQTRQKLGYKLSASSGTKSATYAADVVEQVQTQLGVTADGEWGPQSAKALKTFEGANGLPVDGKLDDAVLTAMGIDPEADAAATSTPVTSTNPNAQALVDGAREQIGVPYASAGTTPSGFDCSGLTVYVFKAAGIKLPRTSFDQYEEGTEVTKDQIQPGDLVFFDSAGSGASHVGIATSATTVISATSRGVMEHKIFDSYWGSHFVGARRVTA